MTEKPPFKLAPGQSRPFKIHLTTQNPLPSSLSLEITFAACESPSSLLKMVVSHTFSTSEIHAPHKITFLHPGGIVSYAILRPPSKKAISKMPPKKELPILVNLHGAGVQADSHEARHILDSLPDLPAWVIFPSGVTSWSADDWRKCPIHMML